MVRWSKYGLEGEPVALIFGEQQQYSSIAYDLARSYRSSPHWGNALASFTYAPSIKSPALQAADLFAYEAIRREAARRKGEPVPARAAAKAIADAGIQLINAPYDDFEHMRTFMEQIRMNPEFQELEDRLLQRPF